MTTLLTGAIDRIKIQWLIILVFVQVVSFSGRGAHGENLNSHDLTKYWKGTGLSGCCTNLHGSKIALSVYILLC